MVPSNLSYPMSLVAPLALVSMLLRRKPSYDYEGLVGARSRRHSRMWPPSHAGILWYDHLSRMAILAGWRGCLKPSRIPVRQSKIGIRPITSCGESPSDRVGSLIHRSPVSQHRAGYLNPAAWVANALCATWEALPALGIQRDAGCMGSDLWAVRRVTPIEVYWGRGGAIGGCTLPHGLS